MKNCRYNVLFCTKYRRKILEHPDELETILTEIANENDFSLENIVVEEDHVGFILICSYDKSVKQCLARLKSRSAAQLKALHPELITRVPNIWTRFDFVETIGYADLSAKNLFLEQQKGV